SPAGSKIRCARAPGRALAIAPRRACPKIRSRSPALGAAGGAVWASETAVSRALTRARAQREQPDEAWASTSARGAPEEDSGPPPRTAGARVASCSWRATGSMSGEVTRQRAVQFPGFERRSEETHEERSDATWAPEGRLGRAASPRRAPSHGPDQPAA